MRNVLWGTLTTILVCSQLVAGILVVSVLVGSVGDELRDTGPQLFGGFFLAAVIAGPVLGTLRPLAHRRSGRALIGGLLSTITFTTQFLVMGANEALQSWTTFVFIVPATFVIGAVMSPLFTDSMLMFNVDHFVAAIWHEPEA